MMTGRRILPDLVDGLLIWLFLVGIYVDVAVQLSANVPVPSVIAGAAGCLMLIKNANRIEERHVVALVGVLLLYLLSILCAPDYSYLFGRLKGLIQLAYSFVVGYGFFVTITKYDRLGAARFFLAFCAFIVIGCFLENYTGFRAVSDAFRERVYNFGLYSSDIRDELLYGRIRPKLFTSEPSAVSFAFALFSFAWYVLSKWRLKVVGYLAMLCAGYLLMRGPTLLLGVALMVPYEVLLAARFVERGRTSYNFTQVFVALLLSGIVAAAAVVAASTVYAVRLNDIASGSDPSFFSREIGPYLTAKIVIAAHPFAGAGLTGWEGIDGIVRQIIATTPRLIVDWDFDKVSHALTNYFWEHWYFLGLFWGTVTLAGLTVYLRALDCPSPIFCWIVWAVFGQASGAYVSPKTWFVLYLAAAVALLHQREPAPQYVAARLSSMRRHEPRLSWGYDLR